MVQEHLIARRMASQLWGEVQRQTKVAEGIWSFSNAGHGGFIVNTDKYPELEKYKGIVLRHAKSNTYYQSEQHFAPFEEDCEYAKVIWLYPNVLKKMSKLYTIEDGKYEEWEKQMLGYVKKSLENWNPEFLEEYPTMGKI